MIRAFSAALVFALSLAPIIWASGARAQTVDLALPANAVLTADQVQTPHSYVLPLGPYAQGGGAGLALEGRVQLRAWRLEGRGLTTLQLLQPLRAQFLQAGAKVLFECEAAQCGGFDFRFNIKVLPAPAMRVGLGDYRFLALQLNAETHASLLVSRFGNAGFIQLVTVAANPGGTPAVQAHTHAPALAAPGAVPAVGVQGAGVQGEVAQTLGAQLWAQGRAILADLEFTSGAADLGAGPFQSLAMLAQFLQDHPNSRVALVGHTDAVGALEGNIALSRRRAAQVVARLVADYGIDTARLQAEGMGFLAPIASNRTAEGRLANRRVEVILLDTD
jgi:OOP family OmpA-OmpF porin